MSSSFDELLDEKKTRSSFDATKPETKKTHDDIYSKIDAMTQKKSMEQQRDPIYDEPDLDEKPIKETEIKNQRILQSRMDPKKARQLEKEAKRLERLEKRETKIAEREEKRRTKRREALPTDITDKDRQQITENFIEDRKLSKREAKRMRRGEKSMVIDSQKFLISFVAVAMFALVMLWSYAPKNDVIMIIVVIVGSALFLPIGMVIGWMMLDPYMRAKIARKVTHKNFGIVNFVGKPNRVTGRLKNFDDDLIWIKTKCWAISKQGIYEVDKNGERATEGKILDPESFVLVTETVPVMFVDINSMTPLRLESDDRDPVSPEEMASILKGWIDAQMAKLMFMKKTMNIMLIIAICAAAAAAYFSYMNAQNMEVMQKSIDAIKLQLQSLILQGGELPP